MRIDNLIVTTLGVLAVGLAMIMSWRWRKLPTTATALGVDRSTRSAAEDALIVLTSTLVAGVTAGLLVAGFGGRLLMRVLGATSGDGAQGRTTEADETVGEITFSGTISILIFVGLVIPVAVSFVHILLRRILPRTAWLSGLVFGCLLLATFGIDDPLSPDNVDFRILTPLPLAIGLVIATALLFGTTFAAIAAKVERVLRAPNPTRLRPVLYLSFVVLLLPVFLLFAAVYVVGRALVRGRAGVLVLRPLVLRVGQVAVYAALAVSVALVIDTVTQITTRN